MTAPMDVYRGSGLGETRLMIRRRRRRQKGGRGGIFEEIREVGVGKVVNGSHEQSQTA